jgi:predicted enzyme related to lactoylglutathione lyase
MQNPFIWHDLMTTDVESAKTFYSKVVGWNYGLQPPEYHTIEVQGAAIGGIMAMPPDATGMPPFWAGYVYVPNVDAACAQVQKLGGKICREAWDIPGIIRMAVVADPTGATFNIMQPLGQGEMTSPPNGSMGTIGWNELHAGELDAAWNFYSQMFGWTKGTTMNMGPMGDYQLFQIAGQDIGGMMKKQSQMPMPMWLYYISVDGIDAAATRIADAEGKVLMGPHQVPGGQWIVMALDPQGGNFALLSATK